MVNGEPRDRFLVSCFSLSLLHFQPIHWKSSSTVSYLQFPLCIQWRTKNKVSKQWHMSHVCSRLSSRSDKDRRHVRRIAHSAKMQPPKTPTGLRTALTSRMTSTLTRHLKSTSKMTPRQQRKTVTDFFVFQTTVLPTMHFTSSRPQKLTPVLNFQDSAAGTG